MVYIFEFKTKESNEFIINKYLTIHFTDFLMIIGHKKINF